MRYVEERLQLIQSLCHQGIDDKAVLAAMRQVPRELFVDEA